MDEPIKPGETPAPSLSPDVYRVLLGNMFDGVSLSDEHGTIVFTNAAEDRLFGYAPGELVGRHVSVQNAYPPQENAHRVAEVIDTLRQSGSWRGEWLNRRKDGTTFRTLSRISAVEVDGRPHWLCVQADNTTDALSEAALRDSEARLALATSAADLGVWDWDLASGRFVYSERAREICGFLPDQEITISEVRSVTHPEDLPRTSAQSERALDPHLRAEDPYSYRILRRDGSIRQVVACGRATFEEVDGVTRAVRYVGTLQDVTEQHDTEQRRAETALRLQLALEASRLAVWEVDIRTDRLTGSPDLNKMLGLPPEATPSAEDLRCRYYPGERERLEALGQAALDRGDRFFEAEYRYVLPSGSLRWLHLRCEIVFDAAGPARAVGVLADVTDRKNAELRHAVLADLAARIRDTQDPAHASYTAAEILGTALGVSRAGYGTIDPKAETITIERDWNAPGIQSLAGVLHFRDYGSYIDDLKRGDTVVFSDARLDPRTCAAAGALEEISARAVVNMPVSESGGIVALLYLNHATAREWSDAELSLIREVAEQTRITVERRRAERDLRALNEQLEQRVDDALAQRKLWADIFESSQANIAAWDFERTFIAMNRPYMDAFQQVYGVRPAVGERLDDILGEKPAQLDEARAVFDRALDGAPFVIESDFGDPLLERRSYDLQFSPLHDRHGRRIGAFHYGVDVTDRVATERKLAEAEGALLQSQKMEAMGQLTGGVAHDFNNLLTPIIGGLDMLQRRVADDERSVRMVSGALQSAERAKTLVQRLLAFARRQPLQPIPVDVAALAAGMSDLIESTTGPAIPVALEIADGPALAVADANQLEMAILNLAVNARDAMPDGGRLTLRVDTVALDKTESGLACGPYVRLAVIDTGVGMDEITLSRAIEPFFSTKGIGQGTGLGLSMVHGLAAQLGGELRLNSTMGQGTVVEVWLPATSAGVTAPAVAAKSSLGKGSGVALLIDDEELVRTSTADMLSGFGFDVTTAASAPEALRLLEDGLRVDVVVSDHLMPGMTGADLAQHLKRHVPDLPVLIISGYSDMEGLAPDLPRLTKPFRQADLLRGLENLGVITQGTGSSVLTEGDLGGSARRLDEP